MKAIQYILILCLSFLLAACGTTKKISETTTTTNTSSEHIVSYKDTIIPVPKATATLKIPLYEFVKTTLNKPFKKQQKNGRSTISAQVVHDTLIITSDCDSLAIAAKIKQELIKQHTIKSSQTNTDTKTVSGYSFFKVIGYVLVAFTLGFVAGYFIKFLLKLKSTLL